MKTNKRNKTMNASVLRMKQIYQHKIVVCLYPRFFHLTITFAAINLSSFGYFSLKFTN